MSKSKAKFKVYHWDTFDNEDTFLKEFKTEQEARDFVVERYGSRLGSHGADKVKIVNNVGRVVASFSTS